MLTPLACALMELKRSLRDFVPAKQGGQPVRIPDPPPPPPPDPPKFSNPSFSKLRFWQNGRRCRRRNHLEERPLDQAQARASYTPFLGVIRVAYPKT